MTATAEQNYLLLQAIEANRRFLLMAYQQNPKLLENAEARIKQMFEEPVQRDHPLPQSLPQRKREVKTFSLRGKGREGGKQSGVSLIELVMFIVIVSIAVTGVLLVMSQTTAHSADPLIRKQALAIAESLLEEIELMPFTFCDPDDVNAASAVSAADCTAGLSQDVITGPTPGAETRGSATAPFDNVADYSNYSMATIVDMANAAVAGLGGYAASVAISRAGIALLGGADDGAALRITVTVNGPGNTQVVLDGYRARYAPGSVP